ncbi:flavin-containing monooxygenase [Fodinicola acaciae]|uniref:flavin-containing monooxygenase n=1 Tax=Fodinicola acaciae TaxID=2681555 RepID=UPI0013D436C5|nr:NAD(P)/FAD-dependent oxidoreductase [Fodinicola acaciae]
MTADLGFDPAALREKYRAERDKRLRADGNDQYVEPTGTFGHYLDDPYAEPITREPLSTTAEVVVVGGGFGGLLAAARLREAGLDDVWIVEKGGDFGGTWYWNRYPGAACDIESYIYLPLLEETGYMPAEKYAKGADILAYSKQIGRHFGLYERALFQTEVVGMRWDDADERWLVRTSRGDRIRARYVITAGGPLHRPKLPGVPGIEDFAGHSFHTSRWDYAYTGSTADGLPGLAGKRVGIIGTGATAVQSVPHLGAAAEKLYVFQRTPSSIDVRANRPTDPDWVAGLRPGWQRHRMENFNALVNGQPAEEDLVGDGWTDIIRNLLVLRSKASRDGDTDASELVQLADFRKMEQIRARVDAIVGDPRTAEALKPYYNQFCKRPCFHDEYLDTFNRPNVELVDTNGKGVDRITERGVVVDGREIELDLLIYATGFEVGTAFTRRVGFEVVGRDGVTLTDRWRDGPSTLHGFYVSGFPNLFVVSVMQSGLTPNFPHMLAEQAEHLAYVLTEAARRGGRTVEADPAAEQEWVRAIVELSELRRAFLTECTPGYYNNEGQPSPTTARAASYGRGAVAFLNLLRDWREEGSLAGLTIR